MRAFVIIVNQENDLHLEIAKRQGNLLVVGEKRYAIKQGAYPTNWRGKLDRVYFVREQDPHSAKVDGIQIEVCGETARLGESTQVVESVPSSPTTRTRDAPRVSAETVYERTLSVQNRHVGNRRFNRVHIAGFLAMGMVTTLLLIFGFGVAFHKTPDATGGAPIVITPGSGANVTQSGPAPAPGSPVIVIQKAPQSGPAPPTPG